MELANRAELDTYGWLSRARPHSAGLGHPRTGPSSPRAERTAPLSWSSYRSIAESQQAPRGRGALRKDYRPPSRAGRQSGEHRSAHRAALLPFAHRRVHQCASGTCDNLSCFGAVVPIDGNAMPEHLERLLKPAGAFRWRDAASNHHQVKAGATSEAGVDSR